jgi:hypothetical protein
MNSVESAKKDRGIPETSHLVHLCLRRDFCHPDGSDRVLWRSAKERTLLIESEFQEIGDR